MKDSKRKEVNIQRTWSMPNSKTFSIKPIHELIKKHLTAGVGGDRWVNT